jgi:hypothetical protein
MCAEQLGKVGGKARSEFQTELYKAMDVLIAIIRSRIWELKWNREVRIQASEMGYLDAQSNNDKLGGPPVTTTGLIITLRMEEKAFRYGG